MIHNRFIGLVAISGSRDNIYYKHDFIVLNQDYFNILLHQCYGYNIVQNLFVLDAMADWRGGFGLVYGDHLRDEL